MRKYAAEFIATFFLVFVGAGSIVADVYLSATRVTTSFGILGIALAHGLALALAIAAVRHISGGHVNPAITLAFWMSRTIKAGDVLGYIVGQLAGATAAAFLLKAVLPSEIVDFAGGGVTGLGEGIDGFRGLALEIVLTFFLAFVIWGVAVDKRGPKAIGPLAIGLVVTFDIIAGGPFTGAAMNPARWFGPALAAGQWGNFYVWVLGPVLGAMVGALLYESLFIGEEMIEEEEELMMEEEEEEVPIEPAVPREPVVTEEARPLFEPPGPPEEPPPRPPGEPITPPPPPPMSDEPPITPPRESPRPPESGETRPSWQRPPEEEEPRG